MESNTNELVQAVRLAVNDAVLALGADDLRRFDRAVDSVTVLWADPHTRDHVSAVIVEGCSNRLRQCWEHGWQPADVVAVLGRLDSAQHGVVAAAAITFDRRHDAAKPMHPAWADQLQEISTSSPGCDGAPTAWASAVQALGPFAVRDLLETALGVLARLGRLRSLPNLIPPPGPGATIGVRVVGVPVGGDGRTMPATDEVATKMLSRVRALLAKAESTEFPDEADSLTEKAQELITRYSIDVAMIAARSGATTSVDGPSGVRIHLDPPYVDAKAMLVGVVAAANRCRAVHDATYGFVSVFGFAAELRVVDMLFTSLLAQASSAMVAAGRVLDRQGTSKTRSFRQAFLVSYAQRIGERLSAAAQSTTSEAERTFGDALVPVLARRQVDVDAAVREAYPAVVKKRTRVSSAAGWEAGRQAANEASLHGAAQLRPRRGDR